MLYISEKLKESPFSLIDYMSSNNYALQEFLFYFSLFLIKISLQSSRFRAIRKIKLKVENFKIRKFASYTLEHVICKYLD